MTLYLGNYQISYSAVTCSEICLLNFFLLSACAKWHPSSPTEEFYCESGQAAAESEVEHVASKSTPPDPVLAKDEQSSHTT